MDNPDEPPKYGCKLVNRKKRACDCEETETIPPNTLCEDCHHDAHQHFQNKHIPLVEKEPAQETYNERRVRSAWTERYQGDLHKSFIPVIRDMEERFGEEFYAKILTFLNSSGVGKSRLVDKLGEEKLVIAFTFRLAGDTGFPPGDDEITERLLDEHTKKYPWVSTFAFIAAVFQTVRTMWDDFEANHCRDTDSEEARVRAFIAHFHTSMAPRSRLPGAGQGTPPIASVLRPLSGKQPLVSNGAYQLFRSKERIKFCADVLAKMEELRIGCWKDTVSQGQMNQWLEEGGSTLDMFSTVPYIQKHLIQPCKDLSGIFSVITTNNDPVPIFLAFDEITNLIVKKPDGSINNTIGTMFIWLRRTLRLLRGSAVWSIFLSTHSTLEYVVPSPDKDSSSRLVTPNAVELPAAYFSFPFDVVLNQRLAAEEKATSQTSFQEFTTMHHMCAIGRPLWNAFATSQYTPSFVEFIQQKLLSSSTFNPKDENHVLAVLSNRICLEPCVSSRETATLLQEAVKSHLRVILEMDSRHGLVRTYVASEPVVAEAAACLLNSTDSWIEAISTLHHKLLAPGLMDKGRTGDMVIQLLLVYARDLLLAKKRHTVLTYSQPFLLTEFLQQLLHFKLAETALELPPRTMNARNENGPDLVTGFQTARMNFTHFMSTSAPLDPTNMAHLVHRLLQRHAALQLKDTQSNWDLLIPLYFGEPEAKFDRKEMGVLVVQVKDRNNSKAWDVPDEVYENYFAQNNLRVISITFELGSLKPDVVSGIRNLLDLGGPAQHVSESSLAADSDENKYVQLAETLRPAIGIFSKKRHRDANSTLDTVDSEDKIDIPQAQPVTPVTRLRKKQKSNDDQC
ncbi:hypothetical protein BJ508DRAFT_359610 [Ascobolus immersus RN42]|uniref:Uncharacterized protein n=1 Tax=Ascobolus immersus RN42 TaxID=1160509 RepID=A0A3N4IEL2_ASCIM|nr:hypothetical protein BJ508DRAFT_359610 [Ascobolus immersus RN42]